jgi:glycosyltransferase involved in cell wall biosynthesis
VSLAVCIITLNEQDDLPRCLASVAGLAAQLVVVDSLSTDGTQQIAREAGAELYERPFAGHVQQKQYALEHAREDWVLCLDADEWLDERLRAEISGIVGAAAAGGVQEDVQGGTPDGVDGVVGYELNRRNEYLGDWIDHCGWSPEWRLRLVRRGRARWTGRDPHDRLDADGRVARLGGRLLHQPYRDLAEHVAKVNRYTDTVARLRYEAGDRPSLGALLLRPPARFLRMYLLRAGFLDGWRGLVVSAMGGVYVFLKYAKLRARWRGGEAGGASDAAGAAPP